MAPIDPVADRRRSASSNAVSVSSNAAVGRAHIETFGCCGTPPRLWLRPRGTVRCGATHLLKKEGSPSVAGRRLPKPGRLKPWLRETKKQQNCGCRCEDEPAIAKHARSIGDGASGLGLGLARSGRGRRLAVHAAAASTSKLATTTGGVHQVPYASQTDPTIWSAETRLAEWKYDETKTSVATQPTLDERHRAAAARGRRRTPRPPQREAVVLAFSHRGRSLDTTEDARIRRPPAHDALEDRDQDAQRVVAQDGALRDARDHAVLEPRS